MIGQRSTGIGGSSSPLAEQAVLVVGPTATTLVRGIARAASARGARVVVATANPPDDAADAPLHITSDFSSEDEIDRLFDVALTPLPRLDVVVAVLDVPALHALHAVSLERWQSCISAPLRLAFWLAQRTLDEFVASDAGGRIIFVVNRPEGEPVGDGVRIVAEALASLARSVSREYGRSAVSCQVVVQSPPDGELPSTVDGHRALIEWVLFLASPAAAFVSGEVVAIGNPIVPPSGSAGPR